MRFKVIPADEGFYELFTKAAANNQHASTLLRELFVNYGEREAIRERIRQTEHEGDRVYRKTVAALFSGGYDAMDVLRSKEIVDSLERALDHCESVASTLETIALKHA